MINLLKWRNAELDEKPELGKVVLVVGNNIDGFALGKCSDDGLWLIQQFGEEKVASYTKVVMWAYLPTETEENIPEPPRDCHIQFFNGKEWAELPHKKITSPEDAYRTIHKLGEIPALEATRFKVVREVGSLAHWFISKITFIEYNSHWSKQELAIVESSEYMPVPRVGDEVSFVGKKFSFYGMVRGVSFLYDDLENSVLVYVEIRNEQ